MAKRTGNANQRQSRKAGRSRGLVCPECGFRAAHAAGLGRHRSAAHGVVSKRSQVMKARGQRTKAGDRELARRVADLERRYDRLLDGLERFVKRARR